MTPVVQVGATDRMARLRPIPEPGEAAVGACKKRSPQAAEGVGLAGLTLNAPRAEFQE